MNELAHIRPAGRLTVVRPLVMLLLGLMLVDVVLGGPEQAETKPGSLASSGSLFDQLFARHDNGTLSYEIPFPFTALTERIASRLSREYQRPAIPQVLIPLGRSLQRYAAEPDFFKYPRVIVAVDGEPAGNSGAQGLYLKDRLFLGYQERASTIEVISYNPAGGRFEFQVVTNYGPGLKPEVSYARRGLCTLCHQNEGPIWSTPPWEETNVNPAIGSLLEEHRQSFHGVPANLAFQGSDIAFRIARSVERASLFTAQQQLWQLGCASAACRAELSLAMLQHRLSGNRGYDQSSVDLTQFMDGWNQIWPKGLPVVDPHIPNRDPLVADAGESDRFDPVRPRPSRTVISPASASNTRRAIGGLAGFLSETDIRKLDRHLFESGQALPGPRRRLTTSCAFSKLALSDWGLQVRFICGEPGGDQPALSGQFYWESGNPIRGTVERMQFHPDETLIKLTLTGPAIEDIETDEHLRLSISQPVGDIHARLTNGHVLETLDLRWDDLVSEGTGASEELVRYPDNGEAVLTLIDDFGPVRSALADLVRRTDQGLSDVLAAKPLDGAELVDALLVALEQNRR